MRRIAVKLTDSELASLKRLVSSGTARAREITHARVLLLSHEGLPDAQIVERSGASRASTTRVRERYAQGGVKAALARKPQPKRPEKRKLTDEVEARLVALACSSAPEGRVRWTLRLLAERAVELGISLSHESVRQTLKKTNCALGR